MRVPALRRADEPGRRGPLSAAGARRVHETCFLRGVVLALTETDSELTTALVRHARAAGRIRLQVDALVGDARLAARIERSVATRAGVARVRADPRSGRVLIVVAPDAPLLDELASLAQPGHRRRAGANGSAPLPAAHALAVDAVVAALRTDLHEGLSEREAKRRLARHGPNVLDGARPTTRLALAASQLTNLPSVLLLGSAAIALLLGDVVDAGAIVVVLGLNAAIGYRVERKSEALLAAWQRAEAGTADVVRGGRPMTVLAAELVHGDLVLVRAGNVVPADARLVDAHRLLVDESTLTGESEPARKQVEPGARDAPLAERAAMLYRGTTIAAGHGRALITACGEATEVAEVQRLAARARGPRARLATRLDALASRLAWSGVLAAGVSAAASLAWRRRPLDVLRDTIALGVAAVPEGLPVTSTAALVRAMARLRERGVIVRRLGTTETLGGVTVACVDKTGTLTENRMRLETVWQDGHRVAARRLDALPRPARGPLAALLAATVLNSELDYHRDNDGELHLAGSSTESALVRAAHDLGLDPQALLARYTREALHERTHDAHYVRTEHRAPDGSRFELAKGTPEQVAALCGLGAGSDALRENARLAEDGLRVLAVAARPRGGAWRLLGLVGLRDPVREGAAEAVRAAARARIRTVMLTGDQRVTAAAIAREVGLTGRVIESRELAALLEGPGAARRLAEISVIARMAPADKLAVVEALRATGEVVAMAGDGINDAPALRAADVGIAVGVQATDLARQTADIVLEHEDLRTILAAIGEGRIVRDNLHRSVRFQVAGNLGELLLLVGGALVGRPLLSSLGVLWINMLTDTLPGLALALEEGDPDILERPPAPPDAPILDRADWRQIARDGGMIGALAGAAAWLGGPLSAFAAIGAAQFGYAVASRSAERPGSRRAIAWMIGGSAALHLAAVALPPVRALLRIHGPAPRAIASFALTAALPFALARRWRRLEIARAGTSPRPRKESAR